LPDGGWGVLTALKASLMEFVTTSNALFGSVHGFAACWALGSLDGNERHFVISVNKNLRNIIINT